MRPRSRYPVPDSGGATPFPTRSRTREPWPDANLAHTRFSGVIEQTVFVPIDDLENSHDNGSAQPFDHRLPTSRAKLTKAPVQRQAFINQQLERFPQPRHVCSYDPALAMQPSPMLIVFKEQEASEFLCGPDANHERVYLVAYRLMPLKT